MNFDSYNYFLPQRLIAQKPAMPRDASRLFVYDTARDKIVFDYFYNLANYLPKNSFMVLDNTKVLPARVVLKKQTGGKVVCLLLINEIEARTPDGCTKLRTMVDRKIQVGDKLFIDKNHFFEVTNQEKNIFYLKYTFNYQWLLDKLIEIGKTPIPLYLHKTPLSEIELRKKYQTIFAKNPKDPPPGWNMGSVAAPTASLHFSTPVFKKLDKLGIKRYFVTLHVGLGTFTPITKENIENKKLHEEYFGVNRGTLQSINKLKQKGKKLVAVGTTVTRTLESVEQFLSHESLTTPGAVPSKVKKLHLPPQEIFSKTDLFIMPSYHFKMVDYLITNFHLPKSSLMMLVEAFLQYKNSKKGLVDLYQIAIEEKFRFYSFGDAMLLL